jgi:diacylglycerol kinase (ATP)
MKEELTTNRAVRVIYNPTSGGDGHTAEILNRQLEDLSPELIPTESIEDAHEAAREWKSGLLVAAGGDGTVNEVVNGLGQAGFPEGVTFAILPLGTGNDLAATLCVPSEVETAARLLREGEVRTLDAVRIGLSGGEESFFVNAATGGIGEEISEAADDEDLKRRWGRLSYLRAFAEAARDYEPRRVKLDLDGVGQDLRAVNVVVGNCRYIGAGWLAAPKANPEDGLLDVVAIEDASVARMLTVASPARSGEDYTEREGVFAARAAKVRVESEPELGFTADGEIIGKSPTEFTVLPKSLKMIVGPGYNPDFS